MYDWFSGREIVASDLPLGIDPAEMAATLEDFGYAFHSLYPKDALKFRAACLQFRSPICRDMDFDELKDMIERRRLMPDVNDPQVSQLIERSAQAAVSVLCEELSTGEVGINEKFVTELVVELKDLLMNKNRRISTDRLNKVLKS